MFADGLEEFDPYFTYLPLTFVSSLTYTPLSHLSTPPISLTYHLPREPMFADGLEEFDSAREVVTDLIDEYKAAERADYVTWGSGAATTAAGGWELRLFLKRLTGPNSNKPSPYSPY